MARREEQATARGWSFQHGGRDLRSQPSAEGFPLGECAGMGRRVHTGTFRAVIAKASVGTPGPGLARWVMIR
jgi:hypothetical protein